MQVVVIAVKRHFFLSFLWLLNPTRDIVKIRTSNLSSLLRIRDVYHVSRNRNFSIPDPIKEFKYFNPKNIS
jgi:hypothetical protein